jgi:GTP cyclohydrolase I
MDALSTGLGGVLDHVQDLGAAPRPSRAEAEAAVRMLIRWAGDDPSREGLTETPNRVLRGHTAQIADAIETVLRPWGVAVIVEAPHGCMVTRGVHKPGATMVTSCMLGAFRDHPETRAEFLFAVGLGRRDDAGGNLFG